MNTFQIGNTSIRYVEAYQNNDIVCCILDQVEIPNNKINAPLNINKDKFILGSKVYFLKQSKVSREKFRSFYENKNITVTRDPDKADFIIVPDNFFGVECSYSSAVLVPYDDAINKTISSSIIRNTYAYGLEKLVHRLKLRALSNNNTPDWVCIGQSAYLRNKDNFKDYPESKLLLSSVRTALPMNIFEFYDKYSSKLITDSFIQEQLGESVIDAHAYENLKTMLNSYDASNHEVACSIMEQSNYGSSVFYIIMLLSQFGRAIKKNYSGVTGKKFRAMLDYCNFPYRRLENFTPNELVALAFQFSDNIDQQAYNILNAFMKEEVQSRFQYINIKHIEFSEEHEKLLKFKNPIPDSSFQEQEL